MITRPRNDEFTAESPIKAILTDDGRFVHNLDLPWPDLIVFIPEDAPDHDVRWSVLAMFAGVTRELRLTHAGRVLRTRSPNITAEQKDLARSVIDGPGDLLLQKGHA